MIESIIVQPIRMEIAKERELGREPDMLLVSPATAWLLINRHWSGDSCFLDGVPVYQGDGMFEVGEYKLVMKGDLGE